MNDFDLSEVHRRNFLRTGALAAGTAVTMTSGAHAAPPVKKPMPRRPLGKTGADVTILNLGTWKSVGLDRVLRMAYAFGVRYFDSAKSYGSEPAIGRWLQENPEVRKEIFLATKDHPHTPRQLIPMLDERLAALKTDYLDLLFMHAVGDGQSLDQAIELVTSKELKETVDAIKKSGKARYIGFSTHHKNRPEIMEAAAKAGIVDVIMLQYTPWLEKDSPLNRAIDSCHKRGIGLISMKQVAGQSKILDEVPKRMPDLKERGLSPYQGLLHAIWSDERISTACVSMRNTDQIREDSLAALGYDEPMKKADIERLRDACLAAGPTFCADCDGRCSRAAGTEAALDDLTRLLTYHEQYGYRGEARRLYSLLSETQRNWRGADLEAARKACPNGLDFASLLAEAERHLA